MKKIPNILIIDTNENTLLSVKKALQREFYTLFTAGNATEGLDILKSQNIDLVLSDLLLPEMSAIELFRQIRILYPYTMRIILTDKAGYEDATNALNEKLAYRFLNKPWGNQELKVTLRLALEHKKAEERLQKDYRELQFRNEELKESLALLQEKLEFNENIINNINSGIIVMDLDGRVQKINRAAAEIFLLKIKDSIVDHPIEDINPALKAFYHIDDDTPFQELELDLPERRSNYLSFLSNYLLGPDGEKQGIVTLFQDLNELGQAESVSIKNEEKYRQIVQNANSIIIRRSPGGEIIFINEFAQKFFDYTENEILGENMLGTIVPETETAGRNLKAMVEEIGRHPEKYANIENENMRRNGERVWISWSNKAIYDRNGNITEIICIGNDISDRKLAEKELKESEKKYKLITENLNDMVMLSNEQGLIQYVSPSYHTILGYQPNELQGKSIMGIIHPEDTTEKITSLLTGGNTSSGERFECRFRHAMGHYLWVESVLNVIHDGNRNITGAILGSRDITGRKQEEEKIKYYAFYDNLTDLLNRRLFIDRLIIALSRARRNQNIVALYYIDLDEFKSINDTFGHDEGDRILKEVANRLKTCLREIDTIARIGGDEFSVIIEDLESKEGAEIVAKKIEKNLSQNFNIQENNWRLRVSIGISTFPSDGSDANSLLKKADSAMYQAKKDGKKKYFFYTMH